MPSLTAVEHLRRHARHFFARSTRPGPRATNGCASTSDAIESVGEIGRRCPARSTASRARSLLVHQQPGEAASRWCRVPRARNCCAGATLQADARRPALPAARRGRRRSSTSWSTRARRVPPRGAHRRIADGARAVLDRGRSHGVDVGDVECGGRVRLRAQPPRRRPRASCACRRNSTSLARRCCIFPRRMPHPSCPTSRMPAAREIVHPPANRDAPSCSSRATRCCGGTARRRGRSIPDPRAGNGAAVVAARPVSRDTARRAARHVQLLAGRRRHRRGPELRDRGQATLCVAGDPITAARLEAIGARGGDAFGDYQVPLAILTLLQGLGRLLVIGSTVAFSRFSIRGCARWVWPSLPGVTAGGAHHVRSGRHRTILRVLTGAAPVPFLNLVPNLGSVSMS